VKDWDLPQPSVKEFRLGLGLESEVFGEMSVGVWRWMNVGMRMGKAR